MQVSSRYCKRYYYKNHYYVGVGKNIDPTAILKNMACLTLPNSAKHDTGIQK